jgi:hypothetical protein
MEPDRVHYTSVGHYKWGRFVAAELDRRFVP